MQDKGMILIGFLSYRSHSVGDRVLGSIAVLSRGALEWVTYSYRSEKAQTFAFLASSFLVLIWLFSLWGSRACGYSHDKLYFIENGFPMENLLCLRCLENLPVPHIERLLTSKFIVNSPLLVLHISNKIGFISFRVSLQKLFGFWAVQFYPWSGQAGPSGGRPDQSGAGTNCYISACFGAGPEISGGPPDRLVSTPAAPDLRPNWPAGCFQRPYFPHL
jgi:hypothetical protein